MASNILRIFRKWNRILHRDVGYFFFGMTIIYCISGIALNHKKDWNPNYNISYEDFTIKEPIDKAAINQEWVLALLKNYHEEDHFKKYFFPNENTLKVFIDNGTVSVDLQNKDGYIEKITKKPLFYQVNFLHYNPGKWWLWFSDIFCVSLIIIAITGLFVIPKSKNSLTKRGIWFVIGGLLIPILALMLL